MPAGHDAVSDGAGRQLEEVEQRLLTRRFLHDEPSSYEEGVHDAIEAVTQELAIVDIQEAADPT